MNMIMERMRFINLEIDPKLENELSKLKVEEPKGRNGEMIEDKRVEPMEIEVPEVN